MDQEKIKILIIDDSKEWVKRISIFLNMENDMIVIGAVYEVDKVDDTVKLMEPDVVLLDLYFTENEPDGL